MSADARPKSAIEVLEEARGKVLTLVHTPIKVSKATRTKFLSEVGLSLNQALELLRDDGK